MQKAFIFSVLFWLSVLFWAMFSYLYPSKNWGEYIDKPLSSLVVEKKLPHLSQWDYTDFTQTQIKLVWVFGNIDSLIVITQKLLPAASFIPKQLTTSKLKIEKVIYYHQGIAVNYCHELVDELRLAEAKLSDTLNKNSSLMINMGRTMTIPTYPRWQRFINQPFDSLIHSINEPIISTPSHDVRNEEWPGIDLYFSNSRMEVYFEEYRPQYESLTSCAYFDSISKLTVKHISIFVY